MEFFFDLKKAFDVCSRDVLLMKLDKIGIKGTVFNWFKDYLSNRSQYVDINGCTSIDQFILTCILQGSILGPILFLIYINDLHLVSNSLTLMFADDTLGLKSDSDLFKLITDINRDINMMALWFKANKLAVNKNKTKYIIFRARNKKLPENLPDILYNDNEPNMPFSQEKVTILERFHNNHNDKKCRSYKLLGIFLDEHLTFDNHFNYLIAKLNKSLYCIRTAKNILNYTGLRSLYFALIHSHLNYCPIILSCASMKNQNKLFLTQKKAIRILTRSKYNAHTLPLFLNHNILPLQKIIKHDKLKFMHSIAFGYAPESFTDVWKTNQQRNLDIELRNADLFTLPVPRCEMYKKIPIYSLPSEWNSLGDLRFQPCPLRM